MRTISTLALIMISTCHFAMPAVAQDEAAAPLTDEQKIFGLSQIWQEANYNFAFFDQVPGLDWDQAYQEAIPRVLATRTNYEYYRELQKFAVLLGDAHTRVNLPRGLRTEHEIHYPWVLTRAVGEAIVVRNVGKSLADEVPIGSVLRTLDDVPAAEYVKRHHLPYIAGSTDYARWDAAARRALYGPKDTAVTVTLVTPNGEERTQSLVRNRRTLDDEWIRSNTAPTTERRWIDEDIAYVALNTFNDTMVVTEFEQAFPELLRARALILDVRRNGGGNSNNGYRILAHLTNDSLETSKWKTREHVAAYKAWGARGSSRYEEYGRTAAWRDGGTHGWVAPAAGERLVVPTVVLQDHATYSAAEDFLVVVDGMEHVKTVGRRSNGSTGQPLAVTLPGGGRFQVVSKRDTYPDGRDFVGVGCQPDVLVGLDVDDVVQGRDPQLDRAAEILRRQLSSTSKR